MFRTNFGLYDWLVMPSDLTNASNTFLLPLVLYSCHFGQQYGSKTYIRLWFSSTLRLIYTCCRLEDFWKQFHFLLLLIISSYFLVSCNYLLSLYSSYIHVDPPILRLKSLTVFAPNYTYVADYNDFGLLAK